MSRAYDPADGWRFEYEPDTRFIGISHPEGGKASLCHFPDFQLGQALGPVIAKLLNEHTEPK